MSHKYKSTVIVNACILTLATAVFWFQPPSGIVILQYWNLFVALFTAGLFTSATLALIAISENKRWVALGYVYNTILFVTLLALLRLYTT